MTRTYQCLNQQEFASDQYKIIPIRNEDMYLIMQWRNEQIYHLRQDKPLTSKDQEIYFDTVINKLFNQKQPGQILFSYLEQDKCIGYGGLVHINWIDKNAEISFIMDTALEQNFFAIHWSNFLKLIEAVAFKELQLHKIFTYAFDLRPNLYSAIESNNFIKEAELKEHCYFNGQYKNVVIHSKWNNLLILKNADIEDLDTTFSWASDAEIRKYSLSTDIINYDEHKSWFQNKLSDKNCHYFIAYNENTPIGSIRFDINNNLATISYLIQPDYQGKGFGKTLLNEGMKKIVENAGISLFEGIVKNENIASVKIFKSLGFKVKHEEKGNVIFSKNSNAN